MSDARPRNLPCDCGDGHLTPFFEAADVPATAAAPAATREGALDARRGAATLAFCSACGLVINTSCERTAPPLGPHVNAGQSASARASSLPLDAEPAETEADSVVGHELPDALHTLREGAFWDLDCLRRTYLTPGSLARRLRAAGFDVLDLRRTSHDSHFILEATRAPVPTTMKFDLEDDLTAVGEAAAGFGAAAHRQISRWRRIIDNLLAERQRIVVWGAVPASVGFLSTLRVSDVEVPFVVSPNVQHHGLFLSGTAQQIVPPQALRDHPPDVMVVPDSSLRGEAQRELTTLQLRPQLLTL